MIRRLCKVCLIIHCAGLATKCFSFSRTAPIRLVNNSVDSGYPKPVSDSNWPGLGNYATEITEAVKWSNTRAYFFLSNQRYVRYSITNDSADAGYPAAVNNTTWPGLLNP